MAIDLNKSREELSKLQEELTLLEDTITGIASKIGAAVRDQLGDLDAATSKTAQRYEKDFVSATEKIKKNFREQAELRKSILNGENKSKEVLDKLAKLEKDTSKQKEIALRSANNLKRNGLYIDEETLFNLEEQASSIEEGFNQTKKLQKELDENLGLTDLLGNAAKTFANNIDKTGTLAKVLSGELTKGQKVMLGFQAGLGIIVASMFKGSQLIADIRKETGLSAEAARDLQLEFAKTSLSTNEVLITSERLNKAFLELSRQTGLIADFGGDVLETQALLTKQLGLSSEQAGKLSLLARIQSTNTESVLSNTVEAVSALSRQEQVGLDVKGIIEEIANTSAAIAVSLGKNPIELAKAVAQSKLLGLSLSEVDSIASSLLDFESSITNELQAELLIGKDLNLEKARTLALNNDLAGLGEELRNQEEIRLAFSTGNRIQQEAAAKAIGINRDQLAKMVLQQDLNNMAAEQFVATYGEATYQSLMARSASERFADTLEKIKGILGDVGTALSPVLDLVASLVSNTKVAAAVLGGIAAFSFAKLILNLGLLVTQLSAAATAAGITSAFLNPAKLAIGIGGAIAAGALVTGLIAKSKKVDDAIIPAGYGDRILSSPAGSIAFNNQDTIVAGTNLGGGSNKEAKETNMLLRQILTKQGTVTINTTQAGTAFAMNTYEVQ